MQINLNSDAPIYEQIYSQLITYISQGVMQVDEKLPSVRELSSSLHINPNTVVKAYRYMEEQGFIYSVPGKGSFVSEKKEEQTNAFKQEILEDCQRLIIKCKYIDMAYQDLCLLLKEEWGNEE